MFERSSVSVIVPAHRAEATLPGALCRLLACGALRLSAQARAATRAEFTANRRVNRLFRRCMLSGRGASLEDVLDTTRSGHTPGSRPGWRS